MAPSKLSQSVRAVRSLPTRTVISIFKGALAYIVLVILALSTNVRSGFTYPITLTSATVRCSPSVYIFRRWLCEL